MRLYTILPAIAAFAVLIPGIQAGDISGSVSLTDLAPYQFGEAYDFATQTPGTGDFGDLYFLNQGSPEFWANNVGQQGLQDIGVVPLLSITSIPTAGYITQGVPVVVGDSYISLAEATEPGNYIFFQVTGLVTPDVVALNWIYGSEAPGDVPEPASFLMLAGGLGGMALAVGRRKRLVKPRK